MKNILAFSLLLLCSFMAHGQNGLTAIGSIDGSTIYTSSLYTTILDTPPVIEQRGTGEFDCGSVYHQAGTERYAAFDCKEITAEDKTCADKQRILLKAEDGSEHCILFISSPNYAYPSYINYGIPAVTPTGSAEPAVFTTPEIPLSGATVIKGSAH